MGKLKNMTALMRHDAPEGYIVSGVRVYLVEKKVFA